jgi:signal transduction histidine kinase
LAVTVRQAEAGEARLDHQPDAARASFEAIAETGRRSLTDVRRLMELLAEPDSGRQSNAGGLDDLEELTASLNTAGLTVDLQRSGEFGAVPTAVAADAYRIVQEALTNALRHGAARSAVVVLHGERGRLQLDITDDGRGVKGSPEPGGGLTGMRARATLCGGSLTLGTPSDGGFSVSACLPWEQRDR